MDTNLVFSRFQDSSENMYSCLEVLNGNDKKFEIVMESET